MPELPLGPMMVDVEGLTLTSTEKDFLCQPAMGGVILFARNFESRSQVSDLIAEIRSIRQPSLLIAVDQEGGRVQRFKNGFFELPAVFRFGEIYAEDPDRAIALSHGAGKLMAVELLDVGVDFSFAPVLDCANFSGKVIGDRGFHENPETIVKLAGAFIDGMNQAGMSAIGKHFPGHGGVSTDSHFDLPIDNRSLEQLMDWDLIPYQKLAKKLSGVMTAHVQFPGVTEDLPTYSPYWLNQVLRQQLSFNGVIFSDDLSMKGAHVIDDPVERTRLALDAGCDMALICNQPECAAQVVNALGATITADQSRLLAMKATVPNEAMDIASLQQQLRVV